MASSRLYGKTLATLRGSVSNRLLMYCAYVHCSYCLALVLCVALPAVLCVPPVPAGRAIRCLAGRHPSLFTPFLPTAGPLVGPARLSLVTILLPLSNPYPWFYRLWAPPLGYLGYFFPWGNIRYLLGTPAVTFSRHWPVHRPAVIVALHSLSSQPVKRVVVTFSRRQPVHRQVVIVAPFSLAPRPFTGWWSLNSLYTSSTPRPPPVISSPFGKRSTLNQYTFRLFSRQRSFDLSAGLTLPTPKGGFYTSSARLLLSSGYTVKTILCRYALSPPVATVMRRPIRPWTVYSLATYYSST